MSFRDLLRALLPPTAYDRAGTHVGAVINAEANALQSAEDSAQRVSDAMHPDTAAQDIGAWERVFALAPSPGSTTATRITAVLAALAAVGGLSIAYFVRLAAGIGYTITILEPHEFLAGRNRCGDRLYPADIVFVWQVRIDARPVGADAVSDAALQALFVDLKPAHTFCEFIEA